MARTFTKIPVDTFETLQLNAGILLDSFTPSTKAIGNILGATSGGVNFTDTPTFADWGEDIDNAAKNMKELKIIDEREVKISGTFLSVSAETAQKLMGAADIDSQDATHIIPRDELKSTDFTDIWWVGDYGEDGGFIAIHLISALSTTGFQIQTGDKAKGQFAFEFTAHYSMDAQDTVPYEVYIEASGSEIPDVDINKRFVSLIDGETETVIARTKPAGQTVTWNSGNSSVATVSGGVITAEGEGTTIITASITVEGVTYQDSCTVVVEAAE